VLGRIEPEFPSFAAFRDAGGFRQELEQLLSRLGRDGDSRLRVQRFIPCVWFELPRSSIAGVWRGEADRKAQRTIRRSRANELKGFLTKPRRGVGARRVFRINEKASLARTARARSRIYPALQAIEAALPTPNFPMKPV
jgi:hypothetical protein